MILIVSQDAEASAVLCSSLARRGQTANWQPDVVTARAIAAAQPPHVLVADAGARGTDELCSSIRTLAPWSRVFLMADHATASGLGDAPILIKPFDASEVASFLSLQLDLAEVDRQRSRVEARVRELALLVESSLEAIVGLDPDGVVRTWNPGARSTYGYEREEIVGRPIEVLEERAGAAAARLLSGPQTAVAVRRRHKDGSAIEVLLSLSPIPGPSGVPAGWAEVSLDLTQRRKLESALEHGERLAAIGRIAASMTHEINNPLAVILASATRISQIAAETAHAQLAECAADVELAAGRIGGFVKHVSSFARRERTALTSLPVRGTVEMAIRLVRPRALERDVIVFFERGPDPAVMHDPPRLGQALVNLLANAIDAAAMGGKTVVIRVIDEPGRVAIEVDDDGPGIAAEVAGRLFEAFVTTKPPGQGTGLGLSITRQIVEDHGGGVSLSARADPEGGTRALLSIPVKERDHMLVLVVDGDGAVRRALAAEVGRAGYRVATAGTLSQARAMLSGDPPQVILVDRELPDGSAADLFAELSRTLPSIGRGLLTSDSVGRAAGAELVIEKPWSHDRLVVALRELCSRS
ncbi:MAG: PAS domain S-box protein [Deltaproteobacteria bacterium]|nr:PAS domain S-box protein [Deltaproteobacteria bacterium]